MNSLSTRLWWKSKAISVLVSGFFFTGVFGQFKIAALGDFRLENGQIIQDCKVGYQTFGKLNAQKSNAILFPTWYGGTSSDLIGYIGEEQMLDSTKYFIIVVDAFGNSVSSSPSTSITQPGLAFPAFSIQDLVHAQHELLTQHIGLEHLYAVTGISMGGMQTYQWMATYPDFFDRAIPIVGTPELTSYELLIFDLFIGLLELAEKGDQEEIATLSLMLEYALGFSPQYRVNTTSVAQFPAFLTTIKDQGKQFSPFDFLSQMRAIRNFKLAENSNDLASVAAGFKGKALLVYASQDHLLLPETSRDLAGLLNAATLEITSDCGHYSFACEQDLISETVRNFLQTPNP